MALARILQQVVEQLQEIAHDLHDIDAIFQFEVEGKQKEIYQMKICGGEVEWFPDSPYVPTCTVRLSDRVLLELLQGTQSVTTAFLTGKIKLSGDHYPLKKLQVILKKHSFQLPATD